jgi:hypothetical protein
MYLDPEKQRLRDENDELRERVRQLEEHLRQKFLSPPHLGFTRTEDVLLGCLLSREVARRDFMHWALYSDRTDEDIPDIKALDSLICILNRKLKRIGIRILNKWGVGYFLPPQEKEKLKELFATRQGVAA